MYKILMSLIVLSIFGGSVYLSSQGGELPIPGQACTMDAKICPDGSTLGRTGPNCSFPACPNTGVVPPQPKKTGINGVVTLGPTCPVEKPNDPNCAPKPYATSINIMKTGTKEIFKTVQTDANGKFTVDLPQNKYDLQAVGGAVLPRCGMVSVIVRSTEYAKVEISCDSGIR
jgi:hypothetical protein